MRGLTIIHPDGRVTQPSSKPIRNFLKQKIQNLVYPFAPQPCLVGVSSDFSKLRQDGEMHSRARKPRDEVGELLHGPMLEASGGGGGGNGDYKVRTPSRSESFDNAHKNYARYDEELKEMRESGRSREEIQRVEDAKRETGKWIYYLQEGFRRDEEARIERLDRTIMGLDHSVSSTNYSYTPSSSGSSDMEEKWHKWLGRVLFGSLVIGGSFVGISYLIRQNSPSPKPVTSVQTRSPDYAVKHIQNGVTLPDGVTVQNVERRTKSMVIFKGSDDIYYLQIDYRAVIAGFTVIKDNNPNTQSEVSSQSTSSNGYVDPSTGYFVINAKNYPIQDFKKGTTFPNGLKVKKVGTRDIHDVNFIASNENWYIAKQIDDKHTIIVLTYLKR